MIKGERKMRVLQPVSIEGQAGGANLAFGFATLTLQ
jgi:hypothetical protein